MKKVSKIKKFIKLLYKGEVLSPGDVIYITGAYCTLFKDQMILYEGKQSILLKIGEYFFDFSREPNFSLQTWNSISK